MRPNVVSWQESSTGVLIFDDLQNAEAPPGDQTGLSYVVSLSRHECPFLLTVFERYPFPIRA